MKLKVELDGEKLVRCPMRLFLDHPGDMNEIMWYHTAYKRGMLPVQGGLLDQPGLLMDMFRVIDGAILTIEREEFEKVKGPRSKPSPAKPDEARKGTRPKRGPVKAKR